MSADLPQPGPRARATAEDVLRDLRALAGRGAAPTDADLDALFALADRFHHELLDEAGVAARCARGCASCCSQQVFDVHAFEVVRIGRRLVQEGRTEEVRERLRARNAAYDAVALDTPRRRGEDDDDWIERRAIAFWTLDLPCPLLAADGSCSVHDVRPWSCRRFFSLSDPQWCRGATARHPERRGILLDPGEDVDALLHALDRHVAFDGESDRLDLALLRWLERPGAASSPAPPEA